MTNVKKNQDNKPKYAYPLNIFSSNIRNPFIITSLAPVPGTIAFKLNVQSTQHHASPAHLIDHQRVAFFVFGDDRFIQKGMRVTSNDHVNMAEQVSNADIRYFFLFIFIT